MIWASHVALTFNARCNLINVTNLLYAYESIPTHCPARPIHPDTPASFQTPSNFGLLEHSLPDRTQKRRDQRQRTRSSHTPTNAKILIHPNKADRPDPSLPPHRQAALLPPTDPLGLCPPPLVNPLPGTIELTLTAGRTVSLGVAAPAPPSSIDLLTATGPEPLTTG